MSSAAAQTVKAPAGQTSVFQSGNELAALAAAQINYHVMGYYPITPSTEVAEQLSVMRAAGRHHIMMIPADGEHGAAGICYGAATGGGRVLNVTSSQGLLYSLEQLPVQSGTRFPMVLNLATRTVSGPLDIRGDHSDLYFALNAGWIVLMAKDPQAVYDMNLLAVRIGEHPDVRLPVIVAYDGFFTSHQKRKVEVFAADETVRGFVGVPHTPYHALDARRPITIGPYMNDPDLINNKYQLHLAMEAARRVWPKLCAEYAELSGRQYGEVEMYRGEDAECVLVLLNSAADTAKEAVDRLRARGLRMGVMSLTVLRPFPARQIARLLRQAEVVVIADRADSYGAEGGNLSLEIRAALKMDPLNRSKCLSRIYGLGGKDFTVEDAEGLLKEGSAALRSGLAVPFAYIGVTPGRLPVAEESAPEEAPLEVELPRRLAHVSTDETTGRLQVSLEPIWKMTTAPRRIAPGHGACPGCGAFTVLSQFFRVLEGPVITLFQTGCAMVVTTAYPTTAHRVTYLHNLFQNGAATLSGLVEMYHERVRRGEILNGNAGGVEPTFVMVSGDGGMDIGMGAALGTAHRNHKLILLEYDNEGYMNTGSQQSYSTPLGHATSTSPAGKWSSGKGFHHKDTAQIFAATHVPYVFTAADGFPEDLMRKAAKAQWYAKREGLVYGKVLSYCPLNWKAKDDQDASVLQAAVDSCFFPLYEVEKGHTTITYDPEAVGRRRPVAEWLGLMGKTRHLLSPDQTPVVSAMEQETERRWKRLKAMHAHPDL